MHGTSTVESGSTGETFRFRHERFAELVEAHDLSDSQLARRIHVGRQTVGRIKAGDVTPSLETAAKIAAYFRLSLDDLIERGAA